MYTCMRIHMCMHMIYGYAYKYMCTCVRMNVYIHMYMCALCSSVCLLHIHIYIYIHIRTHIHVYIYIYIYIYAFTYRPGAACMKDKRVSVLVHVAPAGFRMLSKRKLVAALVAFSRHTCSTSDPLDMQALTLGSQAFAGMNITWAVSRDVSQSPDLILEACDITSGRTHQIRVHMPGALVGVH